MTDLPRPSMRGTIKIGDTEVSLLEIPAGGTPLRKICRTTPTSIEIVFPLDTTIVVRDEEREESAVRADEALVLIGARRYAVFSAQRSVAIAVTVPQLAVDEYVTDTGRSTIIRDSAVLGPVKKFLAGVMETPGELERLSAYFLEKLLWEMTASLLLENRGAGGIAAPAPGLLDRAMAQIAAYRTDQSLTPTVLAQSLSISMRQLQRIFSSIGSTPSREIRRHRAELAVSMLKNPAFRVLNITQVAHHSGFADAADLRRAFEALGYCTPSQLRARGA
ncbi:helix-turn-helix domain-containing protein [Herbiconiux sp. KACC 21604]|uniref:helix-turn-helix domain-containing protein n=1 Tax=unclassified Herbiconiux TaxID=2618217 RepID=UPI0014930F30|nr:helix-turn-helix domain-containing protein [Herbiconiux sp. SALV-R1]QJU54600.1 helix-turn-helix domain-containing protein [Herbiconiux sp. SALV-R1]WPO85687.1 helix-turn-helix domain-containing protein [Herbiconiux sp. KACC 21604]